MAADPWVVSVSERVKHIEQFKVIGPVNGFITGEQAKGFFMQSTLPPQVLGVIWMLSDVDGDGRMNENEFSVACKLINLKLRGFNLPQTLPPSLKQSAFSTAAAPISQHVSQVPGRPIQSVVGTAAVVPNQSMSSGITAPMAQMSSVAPLLPAVGSAAQSSVMPTMSSVPQAVPMMSAPPVAAAHTASMIPTATSALQSAPLLPMASAVQGAPMMPLASVGQHVSMMPMASAAQVTVMPTAGVDIAAIQQVGGNIPRRPSQDSGSGGEWGIPQPSKLKFTQVFNMSDRAKTGFMSGAQARNILIQSQLPHQALAQIWALSDVDNDGRLCCEEFVLAMYLCEQAKAGHPVPTILPAELIPPTLRRSRTSSIQSVGSAGTPAEGTLSPTLGQIDTSFEDKRRENYEKGQAELERRRKALLDAQRRETEERLRKEREEEAKRERARQEAERKRQEELEKEMQRQREIEAQKDAERKRNEEFKEQARKEAERQRQEEWEKQRLQELMNVRQRQQENLLSLKAKNQSLTIDLGSKEDKLKELTEKISETRLAVTEVKATIDGMRTTRDKHMSDMNALKAQARDQNQRLLNLNQEKARLKARSLASAAASGAETAAVDASVTNKQMVIKQLQEKLDELTKEFDNKETDVNNNQSELQSLKDQITLAGERCSNLYEDFTAKRTKVLALREKLLNPDAAWGDKGGSAWSGQQRAVQAPARPPSPSVLVGEKSPLMSDGVSSAQHPPSAAPSDAFASSTTNTLANSTITNSQAPALADEKDVQETGQRFKALYPFEARNHDELSFVPDDIIVVVASTNAEPGWFSGKLHEQIGWFPEAYCTPLDDSAEPGRVPEVDSICDLQTAAPTISVRDTGGALAMFDYSVSFKNQLSLSKGDRVTLREKLDDWWFGDINGVCGWLPKSYVKIVSGPLANSDIQTPTETPEVPDVPELLQVDESSHFYEACYPYQSEEPGDLRFEATEVILVIKKDGDWWHGLIEDRSGVFPSNYVNSNPLEIKSEQEKEAAVETVVQETAETMESQPTEEQVQPQQLSEEEQAKPVESPKPAVDSVVSPQDISTLRVNQDDNEGENKEVSELTNKSPRSPKVYSKGKKSEIAQVLAPYDATSSNQLSLVRGQLISIRKKTASGWWEGELHAKGKKRQLGWFPASYVKVLSGSTRTTPVSMEMTGRDDEVPIEFPPDTTAVIINQEVVAEPKPTQSTFERVVTLYPYQAQNDDELTFEAGDVIMVLDKEDSAWWKGSLRGQIGVFPSNYVQPKEAAEQSANPSTSTISDATVVSPDAEDSLCYANMWDPFTEQKWSGHTTASTKTSVMSSASNTLHEWQRQNVTEEIVTTEWNYLQDLLVVQRYFIDQMRTSGVISERDIEVLFINWNELILLSSAFNKALKVRKGNSPGGNITMVADIMCQQLRLFTPYIRFCCLQMKGATLLNQKCEEGGAWADVVKRCQEIPQVGGHTLTSYLLKPMQRITKYPLMIKQLLLYTRENHPDYQNTSEALMEARTLCDNVNDAAKQLDNTEKLEWMQTRIRCEGLQERLIFNSLTNNLGPRKLLFLGVLFKSKSKRELLAFLLSDFLLITTASRSLGSSPSLAALESSLANTTCTMYRKPMFLTEMKAEAERDSDTAFVLSYTGGELSVFAPTCNERNNWLKKIALAQKHIADTERAIMQRRLTKEKDSGVVGRVLVSIMAGVDLTDSSDVRMVPSKGTLKIALRGNSIESWGKGNVHCFCEVSLGSQVNDTVVSVGPHPKWDTPMQFLVRSLAEDVLCITVYEKGYFRPNDFMGRAEIRLHSLYEQCQDNPGKPQVMRLSLQEAKKGQVILRASFQLFH